MRSTAIALCIMVMLAPCSQAATMASDAILHGTITLPDNSNVTFIMYQRSSLKVTFDGDNGPVIIFTPELVTIKEGVTENAQDTTVVRWSVVRKTDAVYHVQKVGSTLFLPLENVQFRLLVHFVEQTDGQSFTTSSQKHHIGGWTLEWTHVNH